MSEPTEPIDAIGAELRALRAWLQTPEPLDLRAAVRARLAVPPQRRRLATRRRWVVAVALTVAVAIAVAVLPQGRAAVASTVKGLLRFAGIEVREDPRGAPSLPASPGPLPSSRSSALDEARRQARFPIGVPAALGVPDEVLVSDPGPDGAPRVVSLLYRGGAIRLDEFDGELDPAFEKTAVGPGVQWVSLNGRSGLWFPTPHPVVYLDRQGVRRTESARLAAPTLIWRDGSVTYRLEGPATLTEATAIARSVG